MERKASASSGETTARLRFRAGLLIGVFGVALVAAGWAGVLFMLSRDLDEDIRREEDENSAIAAALEEHTRRILQTADNALLFLKGRYETDYSVSEGMRQLTELSRQNLEAVQVAVADPDGNLVYSAVPLKGPLNISSHETFQVHRERPDVGLYIGKPRKAEVTGTWAFFLTRRIDGPDGAFAGVVSVGLDPFLFGKAYGNISVGTDRTGIVVGRDDHVVRVRLSRSNKEVGDDISGYSPVFREAALDPEGHYEVTTPPNGRTRLASYRVMPDYPLIAIVSISKDDVLAEYWDRNRIYLGAMSLFTLFVAVFCFFLISAERRTHRSGEMLASELAERRKAEEALGESKELFTAFMDHMPMLVCLLDEKGNVLFQNRTSREFFGGDMTGRNARDLPVGDPEALGRMIEDNGKAFREGSSSSEIALPDARGGPRIVEFSKFRFARPGKEPYLGSIAVDVTSRKEAEFDRLSMERKMREAQKMESLGVLAGGIAHDFNNLLHGVVGNVDIALAELPPGTRVHEALKRAESAAQRATELTNQMLAYSGRGKFVIEPVNISAVVGEMVPLLSSVHSKLVSVDYRMSDDLPLVEGDATQLRQVVMNLITNAADSYGGGPGVVRVTTGVEEAAPRGGTKESRYVYLEVADEGCGMDAETKRKMFEPFFSTKHSGRGLGLAAVQGIVRGHKGRIEIESEPGRGTTFRVLLPVTPGVDVEEAEVPAETQRPPAGKGLILLVDDEEAVRTTVGPMLTMHGYRVVTASDGVEAVEIYRERSTEIAAVILDMTMPRMGGAEAFAEMHRIDPRVPVILSSGYSGEDAVRLYKGKGIAGFLQKPYRLKTLVDALREVVKGREGAPAERTS